MRYFISFVVLALVACLPNKTISPKKGPFLFYKIVGINIELMKQDVSGKDYIILDTSSTFYDGQELYYRIKFDLKPDKEAERGNYPSQSLTKCSKEKINSFVIKLRTPTGEVFELNNLLRGLDTANHYRQKPFVELDMMWYRYIDIKDFVIKFNNCHPDVQQGYLKQYGLVLCGRVPISRAGKYFISSEIFFSDNRSVKSEVKLNGKTK